MFKSLFNWKVLLNIVLAIAVFMGLVWLTFRWLAYHTNHGNEVQVPNVVNMSVQNAIEVLDNMGLEYNVDSTAFDPKYRPLQVLQVYPSVGSRMKNARIIELRVNPKTWAPIAVPDVIDNYKFRAFEKLRLVGLKVGDTIYESSISKDAVIRLMYNGATVQPGTLVPKFSTIDVVVGLGPKRNVVVPNVVGYTLQEAQELIKRSYFEVGLVYDENNKYATDPSLIVFYQNPSSGSISDQGVQVDLWVSSHTPAEMYQRISELDNIYQRNATPDPSYYKENPIGFDDIVESGTNSTQKGSAQSAEKKPVEKKPANPTPTEAKPVEQKPAEKPVEKKKVIID